MASISLKSVFKAYKNASPVIRDVSLDIGKNEFCVFIGPSGCGKSTLLRMLAGLEDISSGELFIDDQLMNNTSPAKRGVAMVFQNYALFPHLSVYENIGFGLSLMKTPKKIMDEKVKEAARILHLDQLLDRKPRDLSGGQRQRVAIGRAIVRQPSVFLFDEPLSNLDASLRVQTRLEIAKLHREYGHASTVYVTHDQVEAMTLADRILLLNAGEAVAKDGSIAQFGSPLELYHFPATRFVAGFIGSPKMNFFEATLVQASPSHANVRLNTGETLQVSVDAQRLSPGAKVSIGIRPEHAKLGTQEQHIFREITWHERLGDVSYAYMQNAGSKEPTTLKLDGALSVQAGQRIAISLGSDHIHLFDKDGKALSRTVNPLERKVLIAA